MSNSSKQWGIYENVPKKTHDKRDLSNDKTKPLNGVTNALFSGGIERSLRAKSERRELVDSWFSKSFVDAGGLQNNKRNGHQDDQNGHNFIDEAADLDPSTISFMDRKRNFENVIAANSNPNAPKGSSSGSGVNVNVSLPDSGTMSTSTCTSVSVSKSMSPKKSVQYRGSKTSTLTKDESGDWDFLTTLNDILRQENFIGDSYMAKSPKNESPVPVPLSPRPPRPLRRAERRKEYAKARSMDVAQYGDFLDVDKVERDRPLGQNGNVPKQFGRSPSPLVPLPQTPPQQSPYQNIAIDRRSSGPLQGQGQGHRPATPSKRHDYLPQYDLPPPPPPPKPLNSAMSTSLDSIYDRLKSTEYIDHNYVPNRPLTQIYGPGNNLAYSNYQNYPSYSNYQHQSGIMNPMYFHGSGGRLNSCGYLYPYHQGQGQCHDFGYFEGPYQGHRGSNLNMNMNGSLGRLCGDFRSRSFGSLKGSMLGLDYEDRLLRLESDKETLHLQVSCLSDQIEAQTDKIKDLEKCLDDKRNVLETTEEQLQRELLTRSSLETQKLELLTELSSLRLKQASLERENYELKERFQGNSGQGKSMGDLSYVDGGNRVWDKPPLVPNGGLGQRSSSPLDHRMRMGSSGSGNESGGILLQHGQPPSRVRTPPANAYRRVEQSAFGTVPRRSPHSSQLSTFNGPLQLSSGGEYSISMSNGGVSGGKSSSLSSGNINVISHFSNAAIEKAWERNKSTGNIGRVPLSIPPNPHSNPKDKSPAAPGGGHKSRGIMRILGKLRRSNSGGLDNDQIAPAENLPQQNSSQGPGPFIRGGFRATAQPRLGWVKEPSPPKKPEGPIQSWDSESVSLWLTYIGLGTYSGDVKRWVKSGQQLLDASPHELEKELGVKNNLHRKKLVLALNSFKSPSVEDLAGQLDHNWVIRWLDDVGLPQYKEPFAEAKVDGRVLSYLTTEDLVSLKVTSVLHHCSIKRGIQFLRVHRFNPDCLCRRGGPTPGNRRLTSGLTSGLTSLGNNNGSNGSGDYGSSLESDGGTGSNPDLWVRQVASWTNHRVMEWLRAIDLAEYAPNLRGSGVHGALIIFEARFNAELMATLLSIPGNKTLLRRHLSLQINELVGKHIVQEKRGAELDQEFVPINPTTKVKIVKKSQFPLRRKRLSTDYANEELLCPLDLSSFPYNSNSVGQLSSLDNSLDGTTPTGPSETKQGDKVSNI